MKPVLLITPPFTQLNTPYPATAYIKGFLNSKKITSFQMDLGMEVIWKLFSTNGLLQIFKTASPKVQQFSLNAKRIFALRTDYIQIIDTVIQFLQGKNPTLARQICLDGFLPEASRFEQLNDLEYSFGSMGIQDKAKHLATLFLEDLSDFIVECIDPHFGFSRYAERLGRSANSFDELYVHLQKNPTFIDNISLEILIKKVKEIDPKLLCFSVPFPGNLYSAFRCAKHLKTLFPDLKICMGGGFPNTELREIKDIRVFDFFDFIALDDGELPLELIINSLENNKKIFKRTFLIDEGKIVYQNNSIQKDYKQSEIGTPDYSDLFLDKYISVIEIANPMHSLWSDGRWNKLTLAHGCYWGKCTFCDISLDYIKIYEPIAAKTIVDRMEQMIEQTHESGFHFVDEAAPPALMRELALEIIRRKLNVSWWTNIRFEKSFTLDLCVLLKNSGCIAVSGGLEVASDRLLELIQKGVTVSQVAQVTRNFTQSGIMVHAYLMYGYPTQNVQETVDSLEMVRQMFALGILQSGFWHQFAMTAHSPVGMNPNDFGVIPVQNSITFAHNDIEFTDKTGINHDKFSFGLKKSLFNFMHGIGFENNLQEWFDFKIPKTSVKFNYIETALKDETIFLPKPSTKIVWLGKIPTFEIETKTKKGKNITLAKMEFYDKKELLTIIIEPQNADWLMKILDKISVKNNSIFTFQDLKDDFEKNKLQNFELLWYSDSIQKLRNFGLLFI